MHGYMHIIVCACQSRQRLWSSRVNLVHAASHHKSGLWFSFFILILISICCISFSTYLCYPAQGRGTNLVPSIMTSTIIHLPPLRLLFVLLPLPRLCCCCCFCLCCWWRCTSKATVFLRSLSMTSAYKAGKAAILTSNSDALSEGNYTDD